MFGSLSKKSDDELVRLMQAGKEAAFTELYNRYSRKLVRYFHRMFWQDSAKAQDFLHDLFMKLIENPNYVDASRSFSTWIYSVAHNMCKNEYRRMNFKNSVNGHVNIVGNVEFIRTDIDQEIFKVHLNEFLSRFDEDSRSLFIMRYELELPVSDIAAAFNVPEGTVKSRLFVLKKKLAERLQLFNPAIN